MFKRDRHNKILTILQCFDEKMLASCQCYFGGGTAISLLLNEFRESVDIDFLCSSTEGYGKIRNAVSTTLGSLLKSPLPHAREVRTNENKVTTALTIEDISVKVEIILEGRIKLDGAPVAGFPVEVLSWDSLFAEKLLANADSCLDRSVCSRDIIDLAMMLNARGGIPQAAWDSAKKMYGQQVAKAFHQAASEIANDGHFKKCIASMGIDPLVASKIRPTIETAGAYLPLSDEEEKEKTQRIKKLLSASDRGEFAEVFFKTASKFDNAEKIDWYDVEITAAAKLIEAYPEKLDAVLGFVQANSPACVSEHRAKFLAMHAPSVVARYQAETAESAAFRWKHQPS